MKAIWLTKNSLLWYILTLAPLALVIGGLVLLIRAVRARRSRRILLCAGLNLLASFILFLILMDCARYAYITAPDPRYMPFQTALFRLPWLAFALAEAACACVLALLAGDDLRYRRSHLTADAVRETVDLLPEGICISAPDGTVLLSNLQMNTLCRELTGGNLSDGNRFLQALEETGEKQSNGILARTPDGKTWRFTRDRAAEDGKGYNQLTAADVTDLCRITEELREKNDHLRDVQRRMKEVSNLSGDMFIAQEEAAARTELHNQLGQVLLMGRRCLEHPESTDEEMVRMATGEMNRFLLGDAEAPSGGRTDLLQMSLAMVKSIGVRAETDGELPEDPAFRALLAQAVQECAANTVKHAEGDTVTIRIREDGKGMDLRITNNGRLPKGPVAESGGLLSLRRHVEAAGGTMTVESAPAFALTIRVPKL